MHLRKKTLSFLSTLLVVATNLSPVQANENWFSDLSHTSLIGIAANFLADEEIIGGYPDGTFREARLVNRAEMAKFIANADTACPVDLTLRNNGRFSDVIEGEWYVPFVIAAADCGIITGNPNGTFAPEKPVNTAEMLAMIARAHFDLQSGIPHSYPDVSKETWFNEYAGIAEEMNLFPGRGKFLVPSKSLTRGEVAYALHLILSRDVPDQTQVDESDDIDVDVDVDVEDVDDQIQIDTVWLEDIISRETGALDVSLSQLTSLGDTVPKGAKRVRMLTMDFTTACGWEDTLFDGFTITHEGMGSTEDIQSVYALVDGKRLTRTRQFDREDRTAELRFSRVLVLEACETVQVHVAVDFSPNATASTQHRLVLMDASDLLVDVPNPNAGYISGSFPLRGNNFRIADVSSGTVNVDYQAPSVTTVSIGQKEAVIGKFQISVDSVEDQTLYSITLEEDSSVLDGDISNIAIRASDGRILTNAAAQTENSFVTLNFDPPLTVLEGNTIDLEVIADIVSGGGKSIVMHFEEPSDLFAVGSLHGYGVNGAHYGSHVQLPTETSVLPARIGIRVVPQ